MLITFSGIVGSGKSTNAKQAHRLLQEAGYPAVYLRFRFLTWRKIFQPWSEKKKSISKLESQRKTETERREEPLRHQPLMPLTLVRLLGYLWRIAIFRALVWARLRQKIAIVDRFFYDNFTHYSLVRRRERFYLSVLKKAVPVPDLALMLIAQPQAILSRRPHYDAEYIHQLYRNYAGIMREFPHLTVIKTDDFDNLGAIIAKYVREAVAKAYNVSLEKAGRSAKPVL